MSDSGGGDKPKAGLIKGGIAAAIMCLFVVGWGLLQAADYERQADNKRAEYSEYTNEKVSQACIRITPAERTRCVNEAFEAKREYEANQHDLEAQRKSALWAFIMGSAAVIGMALSAVGVWLVKTTFDETRKANDIAIAQLRGSLAISGVTLMIPNGGFKQIDADKQLSPKGSYVFVAEALLENIGATAVNDICWMLRIAILNDGTLPGQPVTTYMTKMAEAGKVHHIPNGKGQKAIGFIASKENEIVGKEAAKPNFGIFHVTAKAEFSDIFGSRWFVEGNFHGFPSMIKNSKLTLQQLGSLRAGSLKDST